MGKDENYQNAFQKDLSVFVELADSDLNVPLEAMVRNAEKMEAIYDRYHQDWELCKMFPTEKSAGVMFRIGQEFYEKQCYWASVAWLKKARVFYSISSRSATLAEADCDVWIAMACYELGNYVESLKWCMDALLIRTNLLDDDVQCNIQIKFTIARDCMMLGYYTSAQELFKRVYDGTGDINIKAEVFRNMGIISDKQGDMRNSLQWFFKALEIKENLYGKESLETAGIYNSIGIIYCNMERYEESEEYLQKALEIKEEQLSSKDLSLSNTFHQFGNLETAKGRCTEALVWYKKSLDIRTSVLDAGHPLIADSFLSIGGAYVKAGNYGKALQYGRAALEIYIKSLGREHVHTKEVMDMVRILEEKAEGEE